MGFRDALSSICSMFTFSSGLVEAREGLWELLEGLPTECSSPWLCVHMSWCVVMLHARGLSLARVWRSTMCVYSQRSAHTAKAHMCVVQCL